MSNWMKSVRTYLRASVVRAIVLCLIVAAAAGGIWSAVGRAAPEPARLGYREMLAAMDAGRVEAIRIVSGDAVEGWWKSESTARPAGDMEPTPVDFRVAFPSTRIDGVLDRADRAGVGVEFTEASRYGPSFWTQLAFQLALIGVIGWVLLRAARSGSSPDVGTLGTSTARFAHVAGAEGAVEELREIVDFLKKGDAFDKVGARALKGALLHGPPGTGKTLLARAVAGEAGVPFYSMSGSEVTGFLVGLGAHRIRSLFKKARKSGGVIFIDEIDALGATRGRNSSHNEDDRTLNQLLVELDGFNPREGVVVIGATNRPEMLDPALKRPGRIDRMIPVGLPDVRGREAILRVHVEQQQVPLARDVELARLASLMPGSSGADLASLLNEAAIHAGREGAAEVHARHFEAARDRVLLGKEHPGFRAPDREWRVVAFHEAGHALAGVVYCPRDDLHKVTIQPRGQALGVAHFSPEDDHHLHGKGYLQGAIRKALAGRAAEEVVFGEAEVTSGAKSDLIQANRIAREMVYSLGMGDETGFLVHDPDGGPLADQTQANMDREVQQMLASLYRETVLLLEENRAPLTALAEALLARETLTGSEAITILDEAGLRRDLWTGSRAA